MLWPLTLGPAIYLWANQSFFPTVLACWISMCADDPQCQMEHGVAILFRRLFQVMCLLHFLFSAYVMSQVYSVAMRSSQHHIVARRGLCYAATIAVVQLPPIVVQCASFLFQLESPAAIAFSFTAVPLCGFLNLLVFMMQRRTMRTAYGRLWRRILDVVSCSRPPPEAPPVRLDSRDLFQTTVVEAPPERLSKVLDEVDVHADDDDNWTYNVTEQPMIQGNMPMRMVDFQGHWAPFSVAWGLQYRCCTKKRVIWSELFPVASGSSSWT